ncbi:MAG: pantoate--beta-alanine ligase [Elusimicrobiota bacterium]|nr:pantoate--beta-alanine ligase [Elusimicrobiota bacterium]
MEIIKKPSEIQRVIEQLRKEGRAIGAVLTMGALHEAHKSLIQRARRENDFLVVSIFINPTQFGPGEDYKTYPRTFEEDKKICSDCSADLIFAPQSSDIYLAGHATTVNVEGGLTDYMCAKCRPGHYNGVATVVAKLLKIIKPHRAYFGQKDYQQFRVIERMVKDLNFETRLVMCPIIREDDGLAISSRNRYLTKKQRRQAPCIYKALKEAALRLKSGDMPQSKEIYEYILNCIPEANIDYADIYDARKLIPVKEFKDDVVIAAAVQVGKARLIDNVVVKKEDKK